MDRASIRAALLLAGFKPDGSPYKLILSDPAQHPVPNIYVWIYPWWVIGVSTIFNYYRPKQFISATKAWRYIQTLIGE